jgi:hypothetical protein
MLKLDCLSDADLERRHARCFGRLSLLGRQWSGSLEDQLSSELHALEEERRRRREANGNGQ